MRNLSIKASQTELSSQEGFLRFRENSFAALLVAINLLTGILVGILYLRIF